MASGIRGTVEAQLENMSLRDKRLLAGLFLFVGLVGLLVMTYTLISIQRNMESRVVSAKQMLVEVQNSQAEYDAASAALEAQKLRLEEYSGQQLSAHVEQLAEGMGIKDGLRDAQRVEQIEENDVVSTKWKVVLKGRTYDEAVEFLYKLENDGYPLRVETARLKSVTIKREKRVDLTIDLFTFKVEG